MDGKNEYKTPPALPASNARPPVPRTSGNRLTPSPQPTDETFDRVDINSSRSPLPSWELFRYLNMPGDSAVYSLHDGSGKFIAANENCADVWPFSKDELSDKSLADLTSRREDFETWLSHLLPVGPNPAFATTIEQEGHTPFEVALKAVPLALASDARQSRIVIKATPAQLPETLASPLLSSNRLAATLDGKGTFLFAETGWTDRLSISSEAILGLALPDIAAPGDRESITNFIEEILKIDKPCSRLVRIESATGKVNTFLCTARQAEEPDRILIDAKDVTIRSANPVRNLFQASVELINESVIVFSQVSQAYRICYVNRAFERMTSRSFASVAGSSLVVLKGPKTGTGAMLSLEEAMESEEECSIETFLYRSNGDPFWCRIHLCPLRNEDGKECHCVAILEDASEVQLAAKELAQRNLELKGALSSLEETQKTIIQQENLRALGQMASGIAHDFNNLLAPILGFSELLLNMSPDTRDESKLVSFLKKIQVAAQDGAVVVGRLREFYRSQEGEESYAPIDLEMLIYQVRELTRHRWKNQAEASGVTIRFSTKISSSKQIVGNESELRQVLTNLVINAVDAIKSKGEITISVHNLKERICIEVIDTGSGMPSAVRKKCLDPFYTTKGKLGTGLGLSIVFGVVKRHGGEFHIYSKENKGTRIEMTFPVAKIGMKPEIPPIRDFPGDTLRILLVDDEEILLEVLSELLGCGGHVVDKHSDPHEALVAFENGGYDLVITDRAMPGMSGDQLACRIKESSPSTPIYMVTGFGDLIKETGKLPSHIDEVLSKPVPLDLLNHKLFELISGKRRQIENN